MEKKSIQESILSQSDAGFNKKEILQNLINEGFSEEEIKPFIKSFDADLGIFKEPISSKEKKTSLLISVVKFVITPLVVLIIIFAVPWGNEAPDKIIAIFLTFTLIGLLVGIYKTTAIAFYLYEPPIWIRVIIGMGVIAIVILSGIYIEKFMTAR